MGVVTKLNNSQPESLHDLDETNTGFVKRRLRGIIQKKKFWLPLSIPEKIEFEKKQKKNTAFSFTSRELSP